MSLIACLPKKGSKFTLSWLLIADCVDGFIVLSTSVSHSLANPANVPERIGR
jgi:hypothetical protein